LTSDELDNALEELETRLERLRALYEQYFLGFEKIEPTVPRKDVDRRIYLLRREKIRNTGRRFKLQTLIQRYNTFQQYWQRVCREIENGTYRRHLLRAERMMNPDKQLTIATKRRFGKALALEQQAAAEASGAADTAQELPSEDLEPASEPSTLRPARAPLSPAPLSPAPPAPRALSPAPPTPSQFASEAPTAPRLKPPPPAGRPGTRPAAEPSTTPPAERSFESLELDMGFLGSWVPGAPDAPPPKAPGRLGPPPKPASAGRPAGPPPKPESAVKAAPPPKSSPRAAPPPKSSPKAAPPPKTRSTPRAAPPPKPAAERPAKPAAAAAAAEARAINDERVKELHQKLMELKRQNQEAGQVSLEGLAKTLRATESKLREQHKNRKIDFDVVIRDGKAIVKPTVR
jgi:hypothetical protein